MKRNRIVLLILAALVSVISCVQEKKDEYKFIEYIQVEGECFEDHVKQPANYKGEIVHWFNVTEDRHSRYGSVHNWESLDIEETIATIKDPYKYKPPFTVEFWDLKQEDITGEQLNLKGVSEHIGGEEDSGPRYWATCTLRVVQRLDHLPSDEERFPNRKENGAGRGTER